MTRSVRILVVDDDADALKVISSVLMTEGYKVDTFTSPLQALQHLKEEVYDTILVDYQMPEMSGLELLKKIRAVQVDVPVIIFTAYATLSHAVEAVKEGVYHYLAKPLNYDELKMVLRNSIMFHLLGNSHKRLEQEVHKMHSFHNIIGKSKLMKKVFQQIEALSRSDSSVLIQGEKGTGKQVIAETIHYKSRRKEAPFVVVDCSALTGPFLQSELFGYAQGTPGKIKEAEGGTLFLKEIRFLPLDVQARLFTFLKEKEFTFSGSSEKVKADVRVLAAESVDLETAVKEKTFHKNLFYLLKMLLIVVPPLRERREDIPLLAEQFLKTYAQQYQKNIHCFSSSVYSRMLSRDYTENVSEFERLIERACIVCQSQCIDLEDMPELLRDDEEIEEEKLSPFLKEKQKIVEQFERDYFVFLLEQTHGRVGEAAKISGLAERNIYEKLKKYGLKKEDFKGQENSLAKSVIK